MVFQDASDTEAGRDEHVFSAVQALWSSEVVTGTIHNIYTTRVPRCAMRSTGRK